MRLFRRRDAQDAPPPPPTFVCRTCRKDGSIYVAREVLEWVRLGEVFRAPDGGLTYRELNAYLRNEPGPPIRYGCTNCQTYADTLEELVEGADEFLLAGQATPR